MAETNRPIQDAVMNIYKKLTNVQKQSPKKPPTNTKMTKKTDKTVRFVDIKGREINENNKLPKGKVYTNKNKKMQVLILTPT